MKTLLFLVALGTVVVAAQGCGHARNPDTADAKVVVTIEGESRHVGRVLATLPHRSGASEPPEAEPGTVAGNASAEPDADGYDDSDWDDSDGESESDSDGDDGGDGGDGSGDDECDGRDHGGRGRHHARWD